MARPPFVRSPLLLLDRKPALYPNSSHKHTGNALSQISSSGQRQITHTFSLFVLRVSRVHPCSCNHLQGKEWRYFSLHYQTLLCPLLPPLCPYQTEATVYPPAAETRKSESPHMTAPLHTPVPSSFRDFDLFGGEVPLRLGISNT